MNNFFRSKRTALIILISFIVIYLVVYFTTFIVNSLKVVEFAFLTISFGFAPAYYFRNVFKYKNILGWLLNAGTLGLLLIPFIFLILGWFKLNIVFEHSVGFLYLCSFIGIMSLFFLSDEEDINSSFNFNDLHKIDLLILSVFLVFSALLTLKNFNDVYIHWDVFKYWGLDAKYIFEQNQLRDLVFHTDMIIHRYTSFQPIYYSIIYDLYGGIFEQYAAWINIYINLLAVCLIYLYALSKNLPQKLLVSATILVVSYASIYIMKVFSMYADILVAFFLLIFFLILLDSTEKKVDTYWRRVFLLLLIITSFYFIKSHFIYFSIILLGINFLYDWRFLFENLTSLIKNRSVWLTLLTIIAIWVMRFVYFANIGGVSNTEVVNPSFIFQVKTDSIASFIQYLVDMLAYMIHNATYFMGLWWLTIISILFVKEIDKKYLYLYLSAILIFLMPVASYTLRQFDLQSGSLPRYSAAVMYLFPLVISFVHIEKDPRKDLVSVIIFGIVAFHVFLNTAWPMPLAEKFNLSNGTLQSALTKYDHYAEKVLEITGPDARILIADDLADGTTTNMLVPALFIRYFMIYNSVGSQYLEPSSRLYDYAFKNNSDFILLLSYADSFDHCDNLLMPDHDYLIDISAGKDRLESNICDIPPSDIYDFGEAVR
jgi:hypothetical protein